MPITYAGVPVTPTTEATAAAAAWWHGHRIDSFEYQGYLVQGIQQLPTPFFPRREEPRIGVLNWPAAADRFATCFLAVTGTELTSIRTALGASPTAKPLVFTDGTAAGTVTAPMHLIGTHPISQRGDGREFYLLVLADARYFWWQTGDAGVSSGPASWADLFFTLFGAVGAAYSIDAVPAAYLTPNPNRWVVGVQPIPPLIQTAALTVGFRCVTKLTGDTAVQSYATAVAEDASRWASYRTECIAGGRIAGGDVARGLPASVDVVFFDGTSTNVTLSSLALAVAEGVTGSAAGTGRSTADPAAPSGPQKSAYAAQAGRDFFTWAFAQTDATFRGIVPLQPCGLDEAVEWVHTPETMVTRVLRPPWSDRNLYGEPEVGVGGGSGCNCPPSGSGQTISLSGSAPEYLDECQNGYLFRKKAVLSIDNDGITQTNYVLDYAYGIRCGADPSGPLPLPGGGSGPFPGSGQGTTPNGPTGYYRYLEVVTNVCLDYSSGGEISGITVEKTTLLVPQGTVLTPVRCELNPDDCCPEAGSGANPDCCDGANLLDTVQASIYGPFGSGGEYGPLYVTLDLIDAAGIYYRMGEGVTLENGYVWLSLMCEDGEWFAEGSINIGNTPPIEFRVPLEFFFDSFLSGSVFIDDDLGTASIVIEYPCSDGGIVAECVDNTCDCETLTSAWNVYDEDDALVSTVYLQEGSCLYQSLDGRWALAYQTFPAVWYLVSIDGRTWSKDRSDFSCCFEQAMEPVDPPDGPFYLIRPVFDCCPPVSYNCEGGACVDPGDGSGTYATLEECLAACSGGDTTCCGVLPGVLTVTFSTGGSLPMTWNAGESAWVTGTTYPFTGCDLYFKYDDECGLSYSCTNDNSVPWIGATLLGSITCDPFSAGGYRIRSAPLGFSCGCLFADFQATVTAP